MCFFFVFRFRNAHWLLKEVGRNAFICINRTTFREYRCDKLNEKFITNMCYTLLKTLLKRSQEEKKKENREKNNNDNK